MATTYTGPTDENLTQIPNVLKTRRQWVLWRGRLKPDQPGKIDKIPINPATLYPASSTDALTWQTFDYCVKSLPTALEEWEQDTVQPYCGGGLGYVFAADDPYVGIDLDHCVDEVTGIPAPWAQGYVDQFASYTELSQSGTGLHILVEGTIPVAGRRKDPIEIYTSSRFFAVTGWHLPETPPTIERRDIPLETLWLSLFGPQVGAEVWCLDSHGTITNATPAIIASIVPHADGRLYALFGAGQTGWPLAHCEVVVPTPPVAPTPAMPTHEVLAHAFSAKNGDKFRALWAGQSTEIGYPSPSEADLAFCGMLRFYTQDPAQIDAIFRLSGRMRPKWTEKRGTTTIGALTIAKALSEPHEQYTPPPELVIPREGVPPQALNGTGPAGHQGSKHGDAYVWAEPRQLPDIAVTDAADMFQRTYPLPSWLIKGLIPEGLCFFAGSPKSGKTYLAYSLGLALAHAVHYGGLWLDHYEIAHTGPIVYVSLEDDEGDSFWRLKELAPWMTSIPRNRLLFVHGMDFPRLNEGLLEVLEQKLIQPYKPALIVLDPISYLYSPLKSSSDQFTEIRNMLLPLRWLGRNHHCTILGIDHRRKRSSDDVDIFETTYGSNAKLAIADAVIMVVRDDKEVTLHTLVRKGANQTLTLGFEFDEQGGAHWAWKGAVDGLVGQGQYGDLRQRVIEAVSGYGGPLTIPDILAALNMPDSKQTRNAVYQILFRAQRSHEVQKTTRGQYVWAGGN
jgi:hypothetical protein